MIRDIRNAPFQWQDKNTMRLIREAFQEERGNKLAFAIAVYVCMTEIASNQQSDVFIFTQNELAKMTGLSRKMVNQIIEAFERLNIVKKVPRYDERGFLLSCTYELLAPASKPTLAENNAPTHRCKSAKFDKFSVVTVGNNDVTVGNSAVNNRISTQLTQQIEEYIEESIEESPENNFPTQIASDKKGENAYKSILTNENLENDVRVKQPQENRPQAIYERQGKHHTSGFSAETANVQSCAEIAAETASKAAIETAVETATKTSIKTAAEVAAKSAIPNRKSAIANPQSAIRNSESPEEAEFRRAWYQFAAQCTDRIVAQGGIKENPSKFWNWAKRIHKDDERITVDVMKACFDLYFNTSNGYGWRGRTKSLSQFVAAFLEIYQFYNNNLLSNQSITTHHENHQGISERSYQPSNAKFRQQDDRNREWIEIAKQSTAHYINRFRAPENG